MNKIKTLGFVAIMLLTLTTSSFAQTNNLKTYTENKTIKIESAEEYENSIKDEIVVENVKYHIKDTQQQKNRITLLKDKEEEKQQIVTTNNKNEILNLFDSTIAIQEDGYSGNIDLERDSLQIKPNESYIEQYKVTLTKKYNNVPQNELNDVPKIIQENGTTYYLTNPVWNISTTKEVDGENVPDLYNGLMNYEGIKERRIIKNYIATVKYKGTLQKEEIESITFKTDYEEVPQIEEKTSNIPVIVGTAGIIIFSGIIILKRKNVKVYNYDQNNNCRLIKKIHIDKKDSEIDITPLKLMSNKFKVELSSRIYKELKNRNIKIRYFDKQFIYLVEDKEFDINV